MLEHTSPLNLVGSDLTAQLSGLPEEQIHL